MIRAEAALQKNALRAGRERTHFLVGSVGGLSGRMGDEAGSPVLSVAPRWGGGAGAAVVDLSPPEGGGLAACTAAAGLGPFSFFVLLTVGLTAWASATSVGPSWRDDTDSNN